MVRKGTVILLGAGASVSAGYPTAAGLLERFRTLLHKESEEERDAVKRSREQMAQLMQASGSAPQLQDTSTLEEWFIPVWQQFKKASAATRPLAVPSLSQDGRPQQASAVFQGPGGGVSFAPYALPLEGPPPLEMPEPYLEDFFAFYDEVLRPRVHSILTEFSFSADAPHRFRQLRQIAIKAAYQALTIRERDVASYLEPLFNLDGPTGRSAPIVTLNFDMSIEQLASIRDIPLFDGFGQETDEPPMLGWGDEGLHSLSALWRAVSENLIPFVGFQNAPSNATLLLKLHGSLGWFVLEEGNGDIGTREDMRHNTPYQFFRYPYQELLGLEGSGELADVDTLALGGKSDPATRTPQGALTRKAGALWLRPYMIYAIALKAHLNRISLDLLGTFGRLLSQAQHILVIGYSWSDPHINDLLLGAVAQGCALVNVGLHATDERFLALWMQRFPTTYPVVAKRLYSLGGGAKRVLAEQEIVSPSKDIYRFDVVSSLNGTLPKELSLMYQLA